ncbi:MAG: hypothetical protein RLZZ609_1141 [Cyanobacteriota bacterium]|jgi:hypothetical protein
MGEERMTSRWWLTMAAQSTLHLADVLELLRPGSFVRLHDHPEDLPPFQLIHCRGGRCWVRQQSWGTLLHLEVAHRRLTAAA